MVLIRRGRCRIELAVALLDPPRADMALHRDADMVWTTIGLYASNAHLFPLPAVFLTGPALATGIAWVNSVGILGGSVSPPVMGYLRDLTGNFAGGLYALAGFAALAAIVAAVGVRETPAKSSAAEPLAAAAG